MTSLPPAEPPRLNSTELLFSGPEGGLVAEVFLNRPSKANSLDLPMLVELRGLLAYLDGRADVRCVLLSGRGKHFCAGMDLAALASISSGPAASSSSSADVGRRGAALRLELKALQAAVGSPEACRVPVIAAIHNACIGAGLGAFDSPSRGQAAAPMMQSSGAWAEQAPNPT